MYRTIQYSGLECTVASAGSGKVFYILLPEGLKSDGMQILDDAARRYGCTVAVLAGADWNNDLTPWPAPPAFKSGKDFKGKAADFLDMLCRRLIPALEEDCGIQGADRYLVGVSLSGLFALWAAHVCDTFTGIASISGSFWYDGFSDWVLERSLNQSVDYIHISLGDREKNTRNSRMSSVQDDTESIVSHLRLQPCTVDYALVDATHFSPLIPRLELALESLHQSSMNILRAARR